MARDPLTNLDWGMDLAGKVIRVAERQVSASAS